MKLISILIYVICFSVGISAGMMISKKLEKPQQNVNNIDYRQIKEIIETALKSNSVQGFEVEKMKNIKGFTYAPNFISNVDLCKDSAMVFKILERINVQDMRNETKDKRKKRFFNNKQ